MLLIDMIGFVKTLSNYESHFSHYVSDNAVFALQFCIQGVNARGKDGGANTGCREIKALQEVGRQMAEVEHNSPCFVYIVHTQN